RRQIGGETMLAAAQTKPGNGFRLVPATPSATASSNEQQRTRQAAAKAVVPAPKKQAPKLVAAGGDESDWETF
ncbi:hypothetical protein ACQCQW_23995, partial [Ralstonia pseudosolanacearum]